MLPYVIGTVIGLIVGAVLVYVFGVLRERKQADEDLNSAKNQAKQIVNDAYKSAEGKKREALLEAKEEILKAKNDHEREVRERRAELIAKYEEELLNPYQAAELGYIDEVIAPSETRVRIISSLRALHDKRAATPAKKHGNIPL